MSSSLEKFLVLDPPGNLETAQRIRELEQLRSRLLQLMICAAGNQDSPVESAEMVVEYTLSFEDGVTYAIGLGKKSGESQAATYVLTTDTSQQGFAELTIAQSVYSIEP